MLTILIEQFGINKMANSAKKILILDSTSMAGHIISLYLKSLKKYQIVNIECSMPPNKNSDYVDVYNLNLLFEKIKIIKPDIIINCLRVLIEESESNPEKAIYFNSYIPHFLSKIGNKLNSKVIQLSTDCVFSGKKGNYYEDDFKDGDSVYATTKALGELKNKKDLTLRTSFIGPNLKGREEELFHWILTQKGKINGYTNAYWTGITTLELAKAIDKAIILNLNGIYHLVPNKKISKYELLNLIKSIWRKNDININKLDNIHIDKSLIDNRKAIEILDYNSMFCELYYWMQKNKELYKHYIYWGNEA